jgi:GNAT superfamily N-acetyltransferase
MRMRKLEADRYPVTQGLLAELSTSNLSVAAVLAGTAPGQVWADDPDDPRVVLISSPEGYYLAGDAQHAASYATIKGVLPHHAYLILDPPAWADVLDQIWVNRAARRHPRLHLLLETFRLPHWRSLVPPGYQLTPVDRDLLALTDLKNHGHVAEWVGGWHSVDDFVQNGFGYCLVRGDTIASWCIADTVLEERCEMGVTTDAGHRRRGLAAVVVSAAVEQCLERGFTEIGWHCLRSNAGSVAVGRKVGFEIERAYDGYSPFLPAENPADLTVDEYRDWALHYERVTGEGLGYSFHAAEAWAMAGEPERALAYLRRLAEMGWQGRPEWLEHNWRFASLRDHPAFCAVLAAIGKETDAEETCTSAEG